MIYYTRITLWKTIAVIVTYLMGLTYTFYEKGLVYNTNNIL